MSSMSCKELFEQFIKCGGILRCDYMENKCRYIQLFENKFTNKTCTIDPKNKEDIYALDYVLWTEAANPGSKMYYDADNISNIKFHHYQDVNKGGFIINQEDPYIDPYRVHISPSNKDS